jgi:hypothetical protein
VFDKLGPRLLLTVAVGSCSGIAVEDDNRPQADPGGPVRASLTCDPVNLGENLGDLIVDREVAVAEPAEGSVCGPDAPAHLRFAWEAPASGIFRIRFWPKTFKYDMRVSRDNCTGEVLQCLQDNYSSSTVVSAATGDRLVISVSIQDSVSAVYSLGITSVDDTGF